MVALMVRSIDQRPVQCNARSLLFRAHAALERGSVTEAGCLLREAVRLYLLAECTYSDCLPAKKGQRVPAMLLKSLKKQVPDFGAEWLEEIIGYCNQLAHCQFVRPGLIEASIGAVHLYLDCATYLLEPTAAGRLS